MTCTKWSEIRRWHWGPIVTAYSAPSRPSSVHCLFSRTFMRKSPGSSFRMLISNLSLKNLKILSKEKGDFCCFFFNYSYFKILLKCANFSFEKHFQWCPGRRGHVYKISGNLRVNVAASVWEQKGRASGWPWEARGSEGRLRSAWRASLSQDRQAPLWKLRICRTRSIIGGDIDIDCGGRDSQRGQRAALRPNSGTAPVAGTPDEKFSTSNLVIWWVTWPVSCSPNF